MKGIRFISSMACAALCSLIFFGACSGTSKVSDDSAASVVSQGDSTEVAGISGATYQQGLPTVIDFYATWCGPCVRMSPIIEQLAEEFEGKACIGKYNVDENTELAAEFRIMSIPTILLFKGGKMVERLAGSQSKSLLEEKINNLL